MMEKDEIVDGLFDILASTTLGGEQYKVVKDAIKLLLASSPPKITQPITYHTGGLVGSATTKTYVGDVRSEASIRGGTL
jgi:hypothetical protein